MSGWMDSFNQAVGLTDDPEDSKNRAIDAQTSSTSAQLDEYKRQYNQGRSDFAPYRDAGSRSLATLQSSIYGAPQQYMDPAYRKSTAEEITKAGLDPGDWYSGPNGKPMSGYLVPRQTANAEQFDLKNFKPEGTAAYEWQKKRTLEDLGNQMNLLGRGRGSTVQANATARALGDLNANEYEKGYNRLFTQKQDYVNNLLNLVKTAQGAAGSTGTLGQAAANGAAGAYQNQGNTLAGIAQQGFANNMASSQQGMSNLYGGIGAGLNVYAAGEKAGWWGGGDTGGGWDATSGDYGDASYEGDGQLWD